MIKIERVSVMNFDNAIRGARNPMNSWAKLDSAYDEEGNFVFGENDLDLSVADVDGDGKYTSTDARLILQYYAGKIEKFPAEG